jgi:hypothetical protein
VHQWAIETLERLQRSRLYHRAVCACRFWVTQRRRERSRARPPSSLRLFAAPPGPAPATPDAPADPNVDVLLKLIDDKAAPVRRAAVMSLTRYIRFR